MKILKINEFVETDPKVELDYDPDATESIRLNDLKDFPYLIFVNGGPNYGNGKKVYPHFMVIYENKRIYFDIPKVDDWDNNKNLKYNKKYEEDVLIFKDKLIEWLNSPDIIYPDYSHLISMRMLWNHLNIRNNNAKKIKNIR